MLKAIAYKFVTRHFWRTAWSWKPTGTLHRVD